MFGIGRRLARFFCGVALVGSALYGQTLTIAPTGYITAGPGGTQQFTATLTGNTMMSPTVVWSAGGKVGGNATAGTISSAGLYTAPMKLPSSGEVQITAMAMSNSTQSATTFIYLLPAGPTITSVSPNPIPVGTDTITLTGSGFQKGGVIFVGGVQYGATFISSTSISTSIYQGPATSTTVETKNPGSIFGNMLTIPVSGKASGSTGGSGGDKGGTGTGGTGGSGGGSSGGSSGGGSTQAPVISPSKVTVVLNATQQFTAAGATSWTATSGTVTAGGLYTAPTTMPASGTDTVTAKNSAGQSSATVTLVSNIPPTITSLGTSPLPFGVFSTTVTGAGFTTTSTVQLNGITLPAVFNNVNS